MAPLADEFKISNASKAQVENPTQEAKNIKDTVRNAVRGYAEKMKQWDKSTDGPTTAGQSFSKLFMEPVKLNTGGAPNLALVFALVVAAAAAGALGFLFTRESAARRQMAVQLELARDEQSRLEQSVAGLTSDVEDQQSELQKSTLDLKEANAKAALIDTMRSEHEVELSRVKTFYETQISALKDTVRMRGQLARTLQSDLETIKRILERGAVSASVGAAVPDVSSETPAPSVSKPVAESTIASAERAAQVLAVDRENRFIVTDLGPAQGAHAGSFVQLYRGHEHLGQARIDRIYQNLSAATIISEDLLERVEEGDKAFLRLG
jgi:hypothetical protein